MRAFVVGADGKGKLQRIPTPVPAPGEVLIKVLRAGVCNTDLEILQGYMGFQGVLGHEFVGRVVAVGVGSPAGSAAHALLGKRVCGDINLPCRDAASCKVCAAGGVRLRNHCPSRTVLGILNRNGTYADYMTLPAVNCHAVPDNVSDAAAAFCEPLAAAYRIVEQGLLRDGDRVCVLGDGKLGLLVAEVIGRESERLGCRPVLYGKHTEKMELLGNLVDTRSAARDGGSEVGAASGAPLPADAKFDVVVDCTGSPQGLATAAGLCCPLGTVVLKSTCACGDRFNPAPFVIDELRIVGSRCGPMPPAVELLASSHESGAKQRLKVEKYLTRAFPFDDVEEALALAATKGTLKVQLLMGEETTSVHGHAP
jgi:threonine dehydrogenase-like Zn-dependent dehydrogenase